MNLFSLTVHTSKRKTSKKYPLRGRYSTNLPARRESSIKSDLWLHYTWNVLKSRLMLICRDLRYLLQRAGLVCVRAANELLMKIKAMIYCCERLSWMLGVRISKEDYRWWRLDASATHNHYNRDNGWKVCMPCSVDQRELQMTKKLMKQYCLFLSLRRTKARLMNHHFL